MSDGVESNQGKKKASPYMKFMDELSEYCNTKHNQLLGALLTTFEATVDDERKLEALRSRVKNIQSLAWEDLHQDLWARLASGEEDDPSEMVSYVNKVVQHHVTDYGTVLQRLVKAVFVEQYRAAALNKEISRLVHTTRVKIHYSVDRIAEANFPKIFKEAKE